MRRTLAALGAAAALAGCRPVYESGYRFELPAAGGAVLEACVAGCSAKQAACLIPAQDAFGACQDRTVLMQNLCQSKAQIDFQICQSAYAPTGATCIYRICPFQPCERGAIEACEAAYRGCFADCGGTVVEERRCVANCPS